MIRTVCHMGMLYLIREWQPAEQTLSIRVYQASTKPAARSASASRPARPLRACLKKAKQQRLFCRRCFFPAFPHDACLRSPKKREKKRRVFCGLRELYLSLSALFSFLRRKEKKNTRKVFREVRVATSFSHTSRTFLKVSSSYITPCRVQKKLNVSFVKTKPSQQGLQTFKKVLRRISYGAGRRLRRSRSGASRPKKARSARQEVDLQQVYRDQ